MIKKGFLQKFFFGFCLIGLTGLLADSERHAKMNFIGFSQESILTRHKCQKIIEYPLAWPDRMMGGGVHEIAFNPQGTAVWVSGTTHDAIARLSFSGKMRYFAMPVGSSPHGIVFDKKGHLWVTFEGLGFIVRVNKCGEIVEWIDVNIYLAGQAPVNPGPHGLCVAQDGITLWFTGKETSTVGKVNPEQHLVEHFILPTPNAEPIFIEPGSDDHLWCTELIGNKIARITQEGQITEFAIPTPNSRPIGIVAAPDKQSMWFSEEAGNNVARITFQGEITEFPVPMTQENVILASLTFDHAGNLWTESYVNQNNPFPQGPDHIVKIDKTINEATSGNISCIPFTYYQVPTRNSVLHRIKQGPDGNIWFTELAADKVGKLTLRRSH